MLRGLMGAGGQPDHYRGSTVPPERLDYYVRDKESSGTKEQHHGVRTQATAVRHRARANRATFVIHSARKAVGVPPYVQINSMVIRGTVAALFVASAIALGGCGSAPVSAPQGAPSSSASLAGLKGTIGSKDFAEQHLLSQLTSQLLNSRGAETTQVTIPGIELAPIRAALTSDSILGYWEYTGTAWTDLLGKPALVSGMQPQFDAIKALDAQSGIAWLDPAPLNDTYAFAMRSDDATALHHVAVGSWEGGQAESTHLLHE